MLASGPVEGTVRRCILSHYEDAPVNPSTQSIINFRLLSARSRSMLRERVLRKARTSSAEDGRSRNNDQKTACVAKRLRPPLPPGGIKAPRGRQDNFPETHLGKPLPF